MVSYGAQLTLTSPPGGLRPGQSASAVITVAEATNALNVPAAAVQTVGNTNSVTVQDERRAVQVGVRGESTVEITSGLNEADRVVLTAASPGTTANGRTGAGGFGGNGGFGGQRQGAGSGGGGRG